MKTKKKPCPSFTNYKTTLVTRHNCELREGHRGSHRRKLSLFVTLTWKKTGRVQ